MRLKIKRIKLNSILALILSFGVVFSSSAFATHIYPLSHSIAKVMDEITDEDTMEEVTEDVTDEVAEPVDVHHERHRSMYGFEFWLYYNIGDEISDILNRLRRSRLKDIEGIYRIPESCEEFIVSLNDKRMLMRKLNCWGMISIFNDWGTEERLLNLLMEKVKTSLTEYKRSFGY